MLFTGKFDPFPLTATKRTVQDILLQPESSIAAYEQQLIILYRTELSFWQQESEKIQRLARRSGARRPNLGQLVMDLEKFLKEEVADCIYKLTSLEKLIGAEPEKSEITKVIQQLRRNIKKMETHYRNLKMAILEELYNEFPFIIY